MRISEAIEKFVSYREERGSPKTVKRYDRLLRIFCLCMQDPEIADLDLDHILWYFKELKRLGWKPNGIFLISIALRKFFEFCNLRGFGVLNEELIPIRRKEYNIPRVTDLVSFRKVFDQIPKKTNNAHHIRNRALLLMLWDTGARVGEILSLDVSDLDLKVRTAIIKTEKSRGRRPVRQINWTEETNGELKKWIGKLEDLKKGFTFADQAALFVSINKSPQASVRGSRMIDRGVAEVMRVLSNRAGLPLINAHSIRHSMGRDAKKALRDPSAVSDILGHSSIESSMVYEMMWGDELREEWEEVMKYRGHPMAKPPKAAPNFPPLKQRALIPGKLSPVVISTSQYGRMARS